MDRADEIAREITTQLMLWEPIAAALRSYGDEKLEEARKIAADEADGFERIAANALGAAKGLPASCYTVAWSISRAIDRLKSQPIQEKTT